MLFLKYYKVKNSMRNGDDNLFIRITYDNWSLWEDKVHPVVFLTKTHFFKSILKGNIMTT